MDFIGSGHWWFLVLVIMLDTVLLDIKSAFRSAIFADPNRLRLGLLHVAVAFLGIALLGFLILGFMKFSWLGGLAAVGVFLLTDTTGKVVTQAFIQHPERPGNRPTDESY